MSSIQQLKSQRFGVSALFLYHGAVSAIWIANIPSFKTQLNLEPANLGIVFFTIAVGAISGMLSTGAMSHRISNGQIIFYSSVFLAPAPVFLFLAPDYFFALVAALFYGAMIGIHDVAMNTAASDVERGMEKPIMSSFHGMYSLGSLGGALIASVFLLIPLSAIVQSLIVSVIGLAFLLPQFKRLPKHPPVDAQNNTRPRFRLPNGLLLVLGFMTFTIMISEGAVADWSAVLLHETYLASPSIAAFGFAVFSLMMVISRFTGDYVNQRLGASRLVYYGTAIAAAGMAMGLFIDQVWAVIVGLACMGLGLANGVPVFYSKAANAGETPTQGISTVAAIGSVGFLIGPPIIGGIAQMSNLTVGFAIVIVLISLVSIVTKIAKV